VTSDPTSREFRDSVGMFTTGVTVVTARSERSGHGMTANAFASVSLDPLLVLVCVLRDATMHKVLDDVGRFALSVLAADQEDLARYFSDSGRPTGMAQFMPVGWRPGPLTGAPLLDGALAYLECDVEAAYDGGDHTVFLGRARWVERARADGEPLLYFGGRYRRLGGR
jgi:flavin reductase (DIM6/NTAB) family NADH-FMN oxidoreductase RutF